MSRRDAGPIATRNPPGVCAAFRIWFFVACSLCENGRAYTDVVSGSLSAVFSKCNLRNFLYQTGKY